MDYTRILIQKIIEIIRKYEYNWVIIVIIGIINYNV